MTVKRNAEFMRMSLEKAIELCLAPLATEGKSPSYIDWLKDRLRYFTVFIQKIHDGTLSLQDMTVEDGRGFIQELMERPDRLLLKYDELAVPVVIY
jgi:hypothetical protein